MVLFYPTIRFVGVFIIICYFLVTPALAVDEVALLHSTPRSTFWTNGVARGVKSVLKDRVHVSEIFLGSPQDDDEHFEMRFDQIAATWGNSSPVAVIVDGPLAFAFMRKYREDLFVGVPVVYCGMGRPEPEYLRQCGDCTGLPLEQDVKGTVDLIFSLRPETTIVVGIMDGSLLSQRMRSDVEAFMEPYLDRAELLFPGYEPGDEGGLDLESLKSVASSLPRSGAILFLQFKEDKNGAAVNEYKAVSEVASRSDGPVFVQSEGIMTTSPGIVLGGVVNSAENQGQGVGQVVERVLNGESAKEMLVDPIAPQSVVDLTSLARFGVSAEGLPDGTMTRNDPEKPEPSGRISSTGLVAGVSAVTALAVLFVFVRRKRRLTKENRENR